MWSQLQKWGFTNSQITLVHWIKVLENLFLIQQELQVPTKIHQSWWRKLSNYFEINKPSLLCSENNLTKTQCLGYEFCCLLFRWESGNFLRKNAFYWVSMLALRTSVLQVERKIIKISTPVKFQGSYNWCFIYSIFSFISSTAIVLIQSEQALDYSRNNTQTSTFWTDAPLLSISIHTWTVDMELYYHFSCSEYLMDSITQTSLVAQCCKYYQ